MNLNMNRSPSTEQLVEPDERTDSTSPIFSINDKDDVLIIGPIQEPDLQTSEPASTNQNSCCQSSSNFFRGLSMRKRLIIVTSSLICFTSSICYSVAFPFLPFESEKKGDVSAFSVGMILGSFELTVFVSSIFFGIFLGKIGTWFLFIAGVLLEGASTCLFGVLTFCPGGTTFVAMAIAVRCIEALGCAMCQTAALALIAREFPQNTATYIGIIEAFEGFGLMAGPPIGGFLYQLGGFSLPFYAAGTFLFAFGIGAWFILPSTEQSQFSPLSDVKHIIPKFFKIPTVWLSGLFIASSAILVSYYDPTLPVQLAYLDSSFVTTPALVGLVFFLDSVTYTFSSPIAGILSDRSHSYFWLLTFGNVGFLAANLLMGPFPYLQIPPNALWPVITAIGILGVSVSFGFMPTFPAMLDACNEAGLESNIGLLGLVSGFFSSAFSLGSFIGPLLGGYLTDSLGFAWASSLMCILPLINLLCIAIFCLHRSRY